VRMNRSPLVAPQRSTCRYTGRSGAVTARQNERTGVGSARRNRALQVDDAIVQVNRRLGGSVVPLTAGRLKQLHQVSGRIA
jgi:hypothetical protein